MIRTTIARTLIISIVVAGGFGIAGTASAEPNTTGDSGGMGACPVVNSDDNGKETTTYVPNGTKLMGLTCKDGTWGLRAATTGGAAGNATIHGGALSARTARATLSR